MQKNILLCALLCILSIYSSNAQQSDLLNNKDQKRIAKAQKKITKAESIRDKAAPYEQKIKALETEGGSKGKIKRLKKKADSKIILTASYYEEGYKKEYAAYQKAVKRNLKEETITVENNELSKAKDAFKQGKKWRRKSENEKKTDKSVEYLLMANNIQEDAIKHLEKLFVYSPPIIAIAKDTTSVTDTIVAPIVEEAIVAITDSIPTDSIALETVPTNIQAQETVAPAVIPVAAATTAVIVAPKAETIENDIYFTIQIVADKNPLSAEQLNAIYSGDINTVEHKVDDWYKYSVGKFSTYEEAQKAMSSDSIKGFVVAYKGNERISTREAREATKS